MNYWHRYNPNPLENRVEDCVQRAISAALDVDWDTDFSQAIDGRKQEDIWPIMDELMDTVHALLPRLYDGVMRKLQE